MPVRFAWPLLIACAAVEGCGNGGADRPAAPDPASITGIRYLAGGADDGFARAATGRPFAFPDDHGPHPDYRTEWWYFTGNLAGPERRFGFQLTFFRLGIRSSVAETRSDWQNGSVWMAHFAVADEAAEHFQADERLARGHRQLAFARARPFEVRVEDWYAELTGDGGVRLVASMPGYAVDLELDGLDRIVLQGEDGYDRKGPETGNASYYYSAPRLQVTGTLSTGEAIPVTGSAWLDREWGTSALSPGVEGWDWFALQLSDGRDVMYYRLRGADGSTSGFSSGSIANADDTVTRLDADAVALEPLGTWRSRASGVDYPVAWRMRIPEEGLDLDIRPVLRDQELDLTVRYWEGAVTVTGAARGRPVEGRGYLELAGYRSESN